MCGCVCVFVFVCVFVSAWLCSLHEWGFCLCFGLCLCVRLYASHACLSVSVSVFELKDLLLKCLCLCFRACLVPAALFCLWRKHSLPSVSNMWCCLVCNYGWRCARSSRLAFSWPLAPPQLPLRPPCSCSLPGLRMNFPSLPSFEFTPSPGHHVFGPFHRRQLRCSSLSSGLVEAPHCPS